MPSFVAEPGPVRDVVLLDGRVAQIRDVVESDRDGLVAMHVEASDLSLYRRFFSLSRDAAERFVSRVCDPSNGIVGLVAISNGEPCGLATAARSGGGTAEVALFVADAVHGCGVGTLLLEHLLTAPNLRDVVTFQADVLTSNAPMLEVFRAAGFGISTQSDRSTVHLEIDPRVSHNVVAAATAREATAEHRSLIALQEPRSIAVVGVSRERGKVGREVVESLVRGGFRGPLYAVARGEPRIDGVTTVPDLSQVDTELDLVVVAVPPPGVLEVVKQAAECGAGACVVLASGFGEAGPSGRAAQRALVDIARGHSMRLVGPNCLGIVSHLGRDPVHADFTGRTCEPGSVGVAMQSGGVAIALLDALEEAGVGVATMVSLGNQADVSARDLVAGWADDERVALGALYLESSAEARHLVNVARAFSMRKPLVAIFGGGSEAGRRAGASHTAARLTSSARLAALIEASGIISVRDVDEMSDVVRLLTGQPLPAGPKVGIVGNAGGLGVIAADAAQAAGLLVPALTPGNPCDVGAAAGPEEFAHAARMAAEEADALLLIVAGTATNDARAMLDAAAAGIAEFGVPCLVVMVDAAEPPATMTSFRSVHRAGNALAAAARYAAWRPDVEEEPLALDIQRAGRARRLLPQGAAVASTGRWLRPDDALRALAPYSLPIPEWFVGFTVESVVEAAQEIGFPVVVKAMVPGVVHKTDEGLVATGLGSVDEVASAARRMLQVTSGSPLLVQSQVAAGVELAIGVVNEPDIGPMVMVAAGGVDIDVWDDQVFLMPPLTPERVRTAISRLKVFQLLQGHRGRAPADIDAVTALVGRVGSIALELPEIEELDMNPVTVHPSGMSCVDVKLRVSAAPIVLSDGAPALSARVALSDDSAETSLPDEEQGEWMPCTTH
jgi:acyl-CoA synthetase (NDP forming)/GNAT superfamily N-acetyltransferase